MRRIVGPSRAFLLLVGECSAGALGAPGRSSCRESIRRGTSGSADTGRCDLLAYDVDQVVDRDALLLHRVAVAQRDRAVLQRVVVDGDAERRADFVLAAVAPADRAGLVVRDREVRAQQLDDLLRLAPMPSFFISGKTATLTGASDGCRRSTVRRSSSGPSSS